MLQVSVQTYLWYLIRVCNEKNVRSLFKDSFLVCAGRFISSWFHCLETWFSKLTLEVKTLGDFSFVFRIRDVEGPWFLRRFASLAWTSYGYDLTVPSWTGSCPSAIGCQKVWTRPCLQCARRRWRKHETWSWMTLIMTTFPWGFKAS